MIPNTVHFCFGLSPDFGGKPFSFVHYLAVRSAMEVHRPEHMFLWYAHEPSGEWWGRAAAMLEPRRVDEPSSVFGREIPHHAHRADLLRLCVLSEHGGIYLDADVLSVRPLTPLMGHKFVIGQEGPGAGLGLCNGVLMSEPGAEFPRLWIDMFRSFRSTGHDQYWGESAVQWPARLNRERPGLAHVEPHDSFHWPLWDPAGLRALYEPSDNEYPNAYCHHLWESNAWDKYLRDLSPGAVAAGKSAFARAARRFLP